jgi:argininosuccinate synthase
MLKYCTPLEDTPDKSDEIVIEFKDGVPVKLIYDGKDITDSLDIFLKLNELGGKHGIGVVDMVENRYVGIKSRGVYETPGATILLEAHKDIEGIAMDREVMKIRDMLSPVFSQIVYNGYWFSPEMDMLISAVNKSQEMIDGKVTLLLFKGNVIVKARESPSSLYDQDLSSMDIEGGFNQEDSEGFIKINAIRLKANKAILDKHKKKYFD